MLFGAAEPNAEVVGAVDAPNADVVPVAGVGAAVEVVAEVPFVIISFARSYIWLAFVRAFV